MTDLSFSQLVEKNRVRHHRWHGPDQRRWVPADWGNAIAGECGEMCNAIKKLQRLLDGHRSVNDDPRRHYSNVEEAKKAVLKEACDTIHYISILAGELELNLPMGMIDVFNSVSERYGFPERLIPEKLVEIES